MGIFSKRESKSKTQDSNNLKPIIEKFQKWIPDELVGEINGQNYDANRLRSEIATLVLEAAKVEDVQLLQFVGKTCAGFTDQIKTESIENLAQWVYDISSVSLELQKIYKSNPSHLSSIKALGLLAHEQVKSLGNYAEVLDYLGANAKKLDERRA